MQPIRITLPVDETLPDIQQVFVCEGFAVDFVRNKIVPAFYLEQNSRTKTEVPTMNAQGQPTGATTTQFGPWEPYKRFSTSGRVQIVTESNNTKLVDPATFLLATPETSNPVGEVNAIWSQLGPPITGLLEMMMSRMAERGNLLDISAL